MPVTRVVDGDTFYITNESGNEEKIRLIGVDAPEIHKTAKKEAGYYNKEAKKYLTDLLANQKVRLEYDKDKTDRYGRTLAYAYLEDCTFINADLVRKGYAKVMTVKPNTKYEQLFTELQKDAILNRIGLWNENEQKINNN